MHPAVPEVLVVNFGLAGVFARQLLDAGEFLAVPFGILDFCFQGFGRFRVFVSSSLAMKLPTKVRMVSPSGLMVLDPSLVLVWDSKTGSFTLMEMAATREERMSPAS